MSARLDFRAFSKATQPIRRATVADAPRINAWVQRDSGQAVDFTNFLSCGLNVCLISGEGGALFVWRGPGVFEVHVFFEQRGRAVLQLSHAMLDIMRLHHGGRHFWAAIPIESRRVIMFTRLMGWKSKGHADFAHGRCEIFEEVS